MLGAAATELLPDPHIQRWGAVLFHHRIALLGWLSARTQIVTFLIPQTTLYLWLLSHYIPVTPQSRCFSTWCNTGPLHYKLELFLKLTEHSIYLPSIHVHQATMIHSLGIRTALVLFYWGGQSTCIPKLWQSQPSDLQPSCILLYNCQVLLYIISVWKQSMGNTFVFWVFL